jgi:hypothetical protein
MAVYLPPVMCESELFIATTEEVRKGGEERRGR